MGLVPIRRTSEGNAWTDEEVLLWIMFRAERTRKIDAIPLGASYSNVFRQTGRGYGNGIVTNLTLVPLDALRVHGEHIFCFSFHQNKKLAPHWSGLLNFI